MMFSSSIFYLVDYWDILGNHCIYRTNIRSLYLDMIFNHFIADYKVYIGYVKNGLFCPKKLIARSATYTGV